MAYGYTAFETGEHECDPFGMLYDVSSLNEQELLTYGGQLTRLAQAQEPALATQISGQKWETVLDPLELGLELAGRAREAKANCFLAVQENICKGLVLIVDPKEVIALGEGEEYLDGVPTGEVALTTRVEMWIGTKDYDLVGTVVPIVRRLLDARHARGFMLLSDPRQVPFNATTSTIDINSVDYTVCDLGRQSPISEYEEVPLPYCADN
jgi:hypothetical protein